MSYQPPGPYGQEPYRPDPAQQEASRRAAERRSKLLGYLLGGLLIGPLLAITCPFVGLSVAGALSNASNDYSDVPFAVGIIGGLVAPLLIPIPFLFNRKTRPWGVGMLLGAAITMIVLGGLCAGFIYLLTQAES